MKIDLGKSMEGTAPTVGDADDGPSDQHYPSIYLSGIAGLENLPESGTATITFKKGACTTHPDGQPSDCELQIQSIDVGDAGAAPEAEEGDDSDTGDMIDSLAKKAGVKTSDTEQAPPAPDEEKS